MRRPFRYITVFVVALLVGTGAPNVLAQSPPSAMPDSGAVALTDWPAAAQEPVEPGREYPFELLPFIDALSVDYRYGVVGDQPQMRFTLSWLPGTEGILERERVSYDRLPEDIRIERLHLRV
ncbi:MAG: hypothetical protein GVY12_15820, partial [Bacteroidetes bacterium]|nr:hypothetical protein [Bacteroidota bacterium]